MPRSGLAPPPTLAPIAAVLLRPTSLLIEPLLLLLLPARVAQPGVSYHGMQSEAVLAEAYAKAGFYAYPTDKVAHTSDRLLPLMPPFYI